MLAALLALLKAIPVIGGWVDKIAAYIHDKGVKDAQRNKDQRDQAVAGLAEVDAAQRTRDAVDARQRVDPDSVRKPDADSAARGSDGIS